MFDQMARLNFIFVLAIYFVLETGCRPNEAAYLVLKNSFIKTSVVSGCDYVASVPPQATKTRHLYLWGVKRRMNYVIELVRALHQRAPTLEHLGDQHAHSKRLFDWFTKRILKDVAAKHEVVKKELEKQPHHNLRSVRSAFAKVWADADEDAAQKGEDAPANPL